MLVKSNIPAYAKFNRRMIFDLKNLNVSEILIVIVIKKNACST